MILKLHPLFHYQSDVVFRELARQSDSWHFYHFRPTVSNDTTYIIVSSFRTVLHIIRIRLVLSMQHSTTISVANVVEKIKLY